MNSNYTLKVTDTVTRVAAKE